MRSLFIAMISGVTFILSGCFIHMEGRPPPKYSAPSGAHFIKPGMTREERIRDMNACGSRNGLMGSYTREDIEKASKATDEFVVGRNNDGASILTRRLQACMISKGYHAIPGCEGDDPKVMEPCMYP